MMLTVIDETRSKQVELEGHGRACLTMISSKSDRPGPAPARKVCITSKQRIALNCTSNARVDTCNA
jgi:hypothetical protein